MKRQKYRYEKIVRTVSEFVTKKIKEIERSSREHKLYIFFVGLIVVLVMRLFVLQVVQWWSYRQQLSQQHSSNANITPKRWWVYVTDDAWQSIALAINGDIYNIYIDPKFVWDSEKVSEIMTPYLYKHFCIIYGLQNVGKEECIKNIELFTKNTILPRSKVLYYSWGQTWSGQWFSGFADAQITVNQENDEIQKQRESIIESFTAEEWSARIKDKLKELLTPGKKIKNYLWFFDSPALLEALSGSANEYITIENKYYVYITPNTVRNIDKESQKISELLNSYWYSMDIDRIRPLFSQQDTRYVKITDWVNAVIAQDIIRAKSDNYKLKSECGKWNKICESGVPLLHWVGLEKSTRRYYPLWKFAANILWYITPQWAPLYGIEQFFDTTLKWTPWQIRWLATPWIWQVWSNDVSIINPIDWWDVYLTIQPYIQKKVENLIAHYLQEFSADSISLVVMDPYSWNVIASANAPTFDPNNPQESYALRPLTINDSQIIDNDSHVDIPVYYQTWNELKIATYDDRKNPALKKFLAKNLLWAQVFVDKNIAFPYEPGSIIKPFTVSAGLDNDEISLYDYYSDPQWEIKIDLWGWYAQFIRNADKYHCAGTHTFLHALIYSCNVWMVRIAQKIKKEAFFNYMDGFGFGKPTNIELAWEDPWFIDTAANAGLARFFNTAFGQGILATPMQIAAAYSAVVNGWYYIKPRIVDRVYDPITKKYAQNPVKIWAQILKPETSAKMREALWEVVYGWLTKKFWIPWYTLGGKTWTSQIAFKWLYRSWPWRTNASFVGMVTKENLKYIVVIQVRRPRNNQFWEYTAWKIFGDLSKTLIEKDLIQK
jgi:cell division protein FtsI/penicillin-binding protein 2